MLLAVTWQARNLQPPRSPTKRAPLVVRQIDLPEFDREDAKEARLTRLDAPSLVVTSERDNGDRFETIPSDIPHG